MPVILFHGITRLLDINVLLDIAIAHRPGADAAQALFDSVADGGVMAFVFPGSLKDFYFITRRDLHEDTRRAWVALFLDTFLLASFDRKTCEAALGSDEPDFEDGLIRAAAEHEGCTHIITRDLRAFAHSSVASMTPEEYVAHEV